MISTTTSILLINLKSLHYNICSFLIRLAKIFLDILNSLIGKSNQIESDSIQSDLSNLEIKD